MMSKGQIPASGPVIIPLSEEDKAIQAAPSYNLAEAKECIVGLGDLRKMIGSLPPDDDMICFGRYAPDSAATRRLRAELKRILADGHKVSLVMADLKTHSGVAFRSGVWMCTQSTIKAIYVGAVLDSFPQAFHDNGQYIRDAIVLSDNEAYESLRAIYGKEPIAKWCRQVGVDESFADPLYPRDKTAGDMFRMWTRLYEFLNGGADIHGAGRYFACSKMSAARAYLGNRFPVQTKAGWESGLCEDENGAIYVDPRFTDGDPLNDECATNDTGVVYTETGPYLFVIYTDYPCSGPAPDRLKGLTEALLKAHQSLYETNEA